MFLSLTLPFAFFGVFGVMIAFVFRHTAMQPGTLERIRLKNPLSERERRERSRRPEGRGHRGWESRFDSEVQRLRRKSLGLD